jgi:hypothetical protein
LICYVVEQATTWDNAILRPSSIKCGISILVPPEWNTQPQTRICISGAVVTNTQVFVHDFAEALTVRAQGNINATSPMTSITFEKSASVGSVKIDLDYYIDSDRAFRVCALTDNPDKVCLTIFVCTCTRGL